MTSELQRYLLFMLAAGCALVAVIFAVYMLAIVEVAMFVFSTLSLGVGSG